MDRFYYEQYEMQVSDIQDYDDDDEYVDESTILHLWAIYDRREGHMHPIGYMHTADQAHMVCEALNR